MKNYRKLVGIRLKRGLLPGLVYILLILGISGGAQGQTTVRVLPPSPRPAAPPLEQLAQPAQSEAPPAEPDLESLSTRIKEMPVTRRTPPGEKVYPIDLNLKNADLVEAIRVLADTMGLNYNIDPKVKGTVNVRASGKLSKSELLSIMETILTINGATMIKTNELYNIVPADKAATRGLPVYSQGRGPSGHAGPGGLSGADPRQGSGGGVEAPDVPGRQYRRGGP